VATDAIENTTIVKYFDVQEPIELTAQVGRMPIYYIAATMDT
jgi:hypothetical protein